MRVQLAPLRKQPLYVVALLLIAGCIRPSDLAPEGLERLERPPTLAERKAIELRQDLHDFIESAEARLAYATDQMDIARAQPDIRRAALNWKLKLVPTMEDSRSTEPPLRAGMDMWSLWERVHQYLTTGEGKAIFGDDQAIAVSTAESIRRDIARLVKKNLPDGYEAQVQKEIDEYVAAHPIRGLFEHEVAKEFDDKLEEQSLWSMLLAGPFVALDMVGKQLDPTLRLSRSVDGFTQLMQDYPAMVRWQTELLLLDLEKQRLVGTTVDSVERISHAAKNLSTKADTMPAELREEAQKLLDDVDQRQPELRKTLGDLQETLAALDEALAKAKPITEDVEDITRQATEAGESWKETANAVRETIAEIRKLQNSDAPGADDSDVTINAAPGLAAASIGSNGVAAARPFAITDYTATADSLRDATIELRGLLGEVESFLQSDTLDRTGKQAAAAANEAIQPVEAEARALIDHLFWRLGQFTVFATVVIGLGVLLTRVVSKRLRPGAVQQAT